MAGAPTPTRELGAPRLLETFCVEKHLDSGRVRVALRSWSRPGTLLAKLASPLVRRMQIRASEVALDNLEAAAC